MGLTSTQNMNFFYQVLWWAIGQASPWILMLFAVTLAGLVVGMIYRSFEKTHEDAAEFEDEDDY